MVADGNYPSGAGNDKNAPYNQRENEQRKFEVDVEYTIYKRGIEVETDDYFYDDDYDTFSVNTMATDFNGAYEEQHYTILELLSELKSFAEDEMRKTSPDSCRGRELRRIISDCQGWEVIEAQVEES